VVTWLACPAVWATALTTRLACGLDAGQGVVEVDRDSAGDAGGREEYPAFPSAGWQLAGVQGGDGGLPVGGGEQGEAVADAGAGGDEPAGEVVAVQPAAAVDEQAGAGLERMDAAGAGPQRVAEPAAVQGGRRCPSGPGTERPAMSGNAAMPRWTPWSWRCRVVAHETPRPRHHEPRQVTLLLCPRFSHADKLAPATKTRHELRKHRS
jgi:hypothetical protein